MAKKSPNFKMASPQEAYARINELLAEAEGFKTQCDEIVSQCRQIARANGLMFEQRHLGCLPECLNPDLYEEKEVEEEVYDYTTRKRKKQLVTKRVFKAAADDYNGYWEAGDDIEYWIPSSLC